MAKPRPKIGDVFSIPIDEKRVGYGQIISKNHCTFPIYIVVFSTSYEQSEAVTLDEITADEIALVGASMDARIYHGMWSIVGRLPPDLSRVPRPNFKVQIGSSDYIEDFDGNQLRQATNEDLQYYDNRWSRAPIGYESALKALHDVGVWESSYDRLTVKHAVRFPKNLVK